MFFYNAPRGRSRKLRKYEHVDVTREFEILTKRRESLKTEKLEELYEKHDERVSKIREVSIVPDPTREEGSDLELDEAEQAAQLAVVKA